MSMLREGLYWWLRWLLPRPAIRWILPRNSVNYWLPEAYEAAAKAIRDRR